LSTLSRIVEMRREYPVASPTVISTRPR
jgi:hypothetical protein